VNSKRMPFVSMGMISLVLIKQKLHLRTAGLIGWQSVELKCESLLLSSAVDRSNSSPFSARGESFQ